MVRSTYHLTVKQRLQRLLEEQGFEVRWLEPAKGYWKQQDVYRWEGCVVDRGSPLPIGMSRREQHIGSFDTMTDCAKRGVVVKKAFHGFGLEADALPAKQKRGES